MLERTFIHVPGIGAGAEIGMWEEGTLDWETFRAVTPESARKQQTLRYLVRSEAVRRMPKFDRWRLYPTLRSRVMFLDTETDGPDPETAQLTCVGLFDGERSWSFVRGRDLERVPEVLQGCGLLVTYHGEVMDIPLLDREFPQLDLARRPHIDVRLCLRRLGYRGGLKAMEPRLGIVRDETLRDISGPMAALLWRAHQCGVRTAADTLARYCLEDTLNLKPLLHRAYNRLVRSLPVAGFEPYLADEPVPTPDLEVDRELVDWLGRWAGLRWS